MIRVNLLRSKLVRRTAAMVDSAANVIVAQVIGRPKLRKTDSGRVVIDITMREVRTGRWIKTRYQAP